jgi:hypothetical protein
VASSGQQSPKTVNSDTFNSTTPSPFHFPNDREPRHALPPPPLDGFTNASLQGWLSSSSSGVTPTGAGASTNTVSSAPTPLKVVIGLGHRSYSAVSSVDDELDSNHPFHDGSTPKYSMTDDEKFDLDYGHVDFSFQNEVEESYEATRLLGETRTTTNYHSSMANDDHHL